ncbi:hypothetical protein A0H81_10554 [Grifola frondosa]|uniref:SMODS and SLOG-associating 2TM effector domain-containing protein n=1 Tax=Grifola frondosa TaxID=5627 RepID=A0A1C7LYE7_GRIFR|nr:hypothetical protein A0H81_10554 [Grifola frondosa]
MSIALAPPVVFDQLYIHASIRSPLARRHSDRNPSPPAAPNPLPSTIPNTATPPPMTVPSSLQPISPSGPIMWRFRQQPSAQSFQDNDEPSEPTPRMPRYHDDQRRMTASVSHEPRAETLGENISRPARAYSYDSRAARLGERPVTIESANGVGFGLASYPVDQIPDATRSRRSFVDCAVPLDGVNGDPVHRQKTVAERLRPTLENAQAEKNQHALRAKSSGFALNAAIGLQVFLGALTTGVAASSSGGRIGIPLLGGLSTIAASYLARARGSGEPEVSTAKWKDLEAFIRDCEAFVLDSGHLVGPEHDPVLERYRRRFEEIMGNAPNGVSHQEKTNSPV